MIDPRIWESEQVMSLTSSQFKEYIYLINHADDEGRLKISWQMLRSRIFPLDETYTPAQVQKDIEHMNDIDLVYLYYFGEHLLYLQHPNWLTYQTINRPQESTLPGPESEGATPIHERSMNSTGLLTPNVIEVKVKEEKTSVCLSDSKKPKKSQSDVGYTAQFLEFYEDYPRKIEKKAAFAKWNATLKRGSGLEKPYLPEHLIKAARRYAEICAEKKTEESYIKHPATFLGPQEAWKEYCFADD